MNATRPFSYTAPSFIAGKRAPTQVDQYQYSIRTSPFGTLQQDRM